MIGRLVRAYAAAEETARSTAEFGWVVYFSLKSRCRK